MTALYHVPVPTFRTTACDEALPYLSGPEGAGLRVQELGRDPFGPEWAGKVAEHFYYADQTITVARMDALMSEAL